MWNNENIVYFKDVIKAIDITNNKQDKQNLGTDTYEKCIEHCADK